jgi:hypothetical protein
MTTKITEAGISNDESPNDQFASASFRAKRSEVEESSEGTKRNATGSFDFAALRSG